MIACLCAAQVVVKVLKAGVHEGSLDNLASEVAVLINLRHPNTILFMGAFLEGGWARATTLAP